MCLVSHNYCNGATTWLVFTGPVTTESPLLTPVANPRVIVECTKDGHLEVHFKRVKSFSIESNEVEFFTLLSSLQKNIGYVLCGGFPSVEAFQSQRLRVKERLRVKVYAIGLQCLIVVTTSIS